MAGVMKAEGIALCEGKERGFEAVTAGLVEMEEDIERVLGGA